MITHTIHDLRENWAPISRAVFRERLSTNSVQVLPWNNAGRAPGHRSFLVADYEGGLFLVVFRRQPDWVQIPPAAYLTIDG